MNARLLSTMAGVATMAASLALPALAGDRWVLAADSADGQVRYFVGAHGLDYQVNTHGVHVLMAPVRIVSNGDMANGHVAVDARGCVEGGGQMVLQQESTSHYWWSPQGTRLYDGIGKAVCEVVVATLASERRNRDGRSPTGLPKSSRLY